MDITPFFLAGMSDNPSFLSARPQRPGRSFFAKKRTWVNILLFMLTFISAVFVGMTWSVSYTVAGRIDAEPGLSSLTALIKDPRIISLSIVYAVVLLGILLFHEFGHYFACRHYGVDATLPYFIPAPTLIGTMGAFIKIKSPITRKRQLFDIGAAGPLSGFAAALPALVVGLMLSKPVPPLPRENAILFGEPLLLKIIESLLFRGTPEPFDLILHPVAFAGWVGILVTALNLFPVGQLDGGHIFYSLFGDKSRTAGKLMLAVFIVMGVFFWVGWFVWAVLIAFIGMKHPPVMDEAVPLSPKRKWIGALLALIFIFSFTPAPVHGFDLLTLIKSLAG